MLKTSTLKAIVAAATLALAPLTIAAPAASDGAWLEALTQWRSKASAGLKRERGWLSIVSRDELTPGTYSIGSAPGSDILLPKALSPAKLGTVVASADGVRLTLTKGQTMRTVAKDDAADEFTTRNLVTGATQVEWVTAGRLSLQFVKRDDGRIVVRAADRESPRRTQFAGRVWYAPDTAYNVPARFIPHAAGATIPIANVRGEIAYEKVAGTLEFKVNGQLMSFDALDDDGSLFVIFRDATSGNGSYPPGRFLVVEKGKDGAYTVDFNRAFNPPCAFSAYTTCPLPPPQNWLKAGVPAGERYTEHKS